MRDFFKILSTKFCSRNLAFSPLPASEETFYYCLDCWKEIKQGKFYRGGEERVSIVILPRNIPVQRTQFTNFVADSNYPGG